MDQNPTDTESEIVSEYVSHNGTAYTLQVQQVCEQDNAAFEQRNISTPFTLYTVFTGPDVHTDTDRFALIRSLPGDDSWLHDEFTRLEEELNNN